MKKILSGLCLSAFLLGGASSGMFSNIAWGDTTPVINGRNIQAEVSYNGGLTNDRYILGPNDVLNFTYPMAPELNQEHIRVLPDGNINVSLLGTVHVAGLSMEDVHDSLVKKLAYYMVDPKVSINLEESKPFVVKVSGAVLNPGVYEMRTETGTGSFVNNLKPEISINRNTPILSNILVAAGGVVYNADVEHVVIHNSLTGTDKNVNLFTLMDGAEGSDDVYLTVGDTVYVPPLTQGKPIDMEKYQKFASSTLGQRKVPVRVFGYVTLPGLVQLDSAQSLNLNSAIMSAGGYSGALGNSPYAPKQVFISRPDAKGHLTTFSVNPKTDDIALLPNDIVYVPDKARPKAGKFFDYLARVIAPGAEIANTYNGWATVFNPLRYTTPASR